MKKFLAIILLYLLTAGLFAGVIVPFLLAYPVITVLDGIFTITRQKIWISDIGIFLVVLLSYYITSNYICFGRWKMGRSEASRLIQEEGRRIRAVIRNKAIFFSVVGIIGLVAIQYSVLVYRKVIIHPTRAE